MSDTSLYVMTLDGHPSKAESLTQALRTLQDSVKALDRATTAAIATSEWHADHVRLHQDLVTYAAAQLCRSAVAWGVLVDIP